AAGGESGTHPLRQVLAGAVALISERLADGLASPAERQAAWEVVGQEKERFVNAHTFEAAAYLLVFRDVLTGGWRPSLATRRDEEAYRRQLRGALAGAEERGYDAALWWARSPPGAARCEALREVFPPLLSSAPLDSAWLTSDVLTLARASY